MKKEIHVMNGMPVEIPLLDKDGERERARLANLALKEYEDTGVLTSAALLEENRKFLERASQYILQEESDDPA